MLDAYNLSTSHTDFYWFWPFANLNLPSFLFFFAIFYSFIHSVCHWFGIVTVIVTCVPFPLCMCINKTINLSCVCMMHSGLQSSISFCLLPFSCLTRLHATLCFKLKQKPDGKCNSCTSKLSIFYWLLLENLVCCSFFVAFRLFLPPPPLHSTLPSSVVAHSVICDAIANTAKHNSQ